MARHVELHETISAGAMGGMTNMGSPMPGMGAMQMRRVREVIVPAGGSVTFRPAATTSCSSICGTRYHQARRSHCVCASRGLARSR